MPENAEQIEARLCAYIDGELDDAEKAQIEAHLAANPSHATLLGQLLRQKQAIQRLPREHAPADLTDELQAQLEREVLLQIGPVATDIRAQGHWSRWLAAAAIFALASGLGIVVYTVLPKGQPAIVAMDAAPQRPAPPQGDDAVASRGAAVADANPASEHTLGLARKGVAEAPERFAKSGIAAEPPASLDAPASAAPAPKVASVAMTEKNEGVTPAHAQAPQTVVITVTAGDLKQTNQDVLAYLASQDLEYVLADGQTRIDAGADRHGAFYQLSEARARRASSPGESQQPDGLASRALSVRQQVGQEAKTGENTRLAGGAIDKSDFAFGGGIQVDAKAQEQIAAAPAEKSDGDPFAAGRAGSAPPPAPVAEQMRKPATLGLAKDLAMEGAVVTGVAPVPATQPAAPAQVAVQAKAQLMPERGIGGIVGGGGGAGGGLTRDVAAPFGIAGQPAAPAEPAAMADALTPEQAALDHGRVIIVRNINSQQVAGIKEVLFRPAANQAAPAAFRFARREGEIARQDAAGQTNGVADYLSRPAKAIDLFGDLLSAWSAATQPADGSVARQDQQAQQAQVLGAVDGLANPQHYNCVIVLQNAPADAAPTAADVSAGPATRPVAAGEEEKANKSAAEK